MQCKHPDADASERNSQDDSDEERYEGGKFCHAQCHSCSNTMEEYMSCVFAHCQSRFQESEDCLPTKIL